MIQAAIDVGTNTVLLLVAEIEPSPDGKSPQTLKRVLANEIQFARLGEGVRHSKEFNAVAMDRARTCFENYRKICDQHKVDTLYCVATSASRNAKNAADFYRGVEKDFGIQTKIISGISEARLSFLGGLLPGQDPTKHAVMDIGGGSTEFVVLDSKTQQASGQSIDVGCVSATEAFLCGDPYDLKSVDALEEGLKEYWRTLDRSLISELRKKEWVAVAGTPTTLAAVAKGLKKFDQTALDGFRLNRCNVGDLFESLAIQPESQRRDNPVIGPGRSDIVVAGTGILLTAMEFFDKAEVIVSTRGLRHGVLLYPWFAA